VHRLKMTFFGEQNQRESLGNNAIIIRKFSLILTRIFFVKYSFIYKIIPKNAICICFSAGEFYGHSKRVENAGRRANK
jgi:hypothetical protein